jgi:hypothetical protein
MPTLVLHIQNEDPVVCEIDQLPEPNDLLLIVNNPRRRDGKDLPYLDPAVSTVIWPTSRINYIEVMPEESDDQVITHFRD